MKAWIKLGSSSVDVDSERNQDVECAKVENAAETFDAVLTRGNNLEAFVGKARFHELKGQYLEAINEMNKVHPIPCLSSACWRDVEQATWPVRHHNHMVV